MRRLLVLGGLFWVLIQFYLVRVKSFSGDEASSLSLISNGFIYIINKNYVGDFNPPLYFILLKLWVSISTNEYFIRSFGIILGLTYFLLVFSTFKRNYITLVVLLLTSPVVSFSFFFLRSYGLLVVLTMALYSMYFNERYILRKETKYLCVLFIILAGSWTSYLFFVFEFYIFISLLLRDKKFSFDVLFFTGAGLFAFLSVFIFFVDDLSIVSSIHQIAHVSFVKLLLYNLGSLVFSDFGLFPVVFYLLAFSLTCFFVLWNIKTVIGAFKNRTIYWPFIFICCAVLLVSLSGVPRAQYLIVVLVPFQIFLYHLFQEKLRSLFVIVVLFQVFGLISWITNSKEYYSSPVFAIDYRRYKLALGGIENILVYPSYNKVIFDYYYGKEINVSDVYGFSDKAVPNELLVWKENFRIDNELPYLSNIIQSYHRNVHLEVFKDTSLTLGKSYNFGELSLLSK